MALDFAQNDYVSQIMDDYSTSRNLEVQQRAFDYAVLAKHHRSLRNGGRDLIFKVPLTEKQVDQEGIDFDLNFLDGFVKQQLAEGKPDYNPTKSQLIASGEYEAESELKFTPYQQAQFGYLKTAGLNPATQATTTQGMPTFMQDKPQQATLAVNNVKKVWGEDPAAQQQQEQKPSTLTQ